LESANKPKIY